MASRDHIPFCPHSRTCTPATLRSKPDHLLSLSILGTRGIPAAYGGAETFAERLALYLSSHGWHVTVYCQEQSKTRCREEIWNGVRLIYIPTIACGSLASVLFDYRSAIHAIMSRSSLILTLGYNTAILSLLYRWKRIPNLMNMDGLEWRRAKWNWIQRAWLYANERLGCALSDHLIADHPEIARRLARRVTASRISTIPYGADPVTSSDPSILSRYHVRPYQYCLIVARPEPENSILEMIQAFSHHPRKHALLVLGDVTPRTCAYHSKLIRAASNEVSFLGALYDRRTLTTLRRYCTLYLHGHQVGGTNPSLVEAMAAGSPILAHDNPFNRWVAADASRYFTDSESCLRELNALLENTPKLRSLAAKAEERFHRHFRWESILPLYESLLAEYHSAGNRLSRWVHAP